MTYDFTYKPFFVEEYCSEKFISKDEYLKYFKDKLNNFFYENYNKNPEILMNVFDVLGFKYLLNSRNLDATHKILKNNNFFQYLKNNKFGVIHIVFIIWVYDDSSEIKIEKMKQKILKREKFIENSQKKFHAFLNHSEEMKDFKEWYKNEFKEYLARLYINLSIRINKNESQKELLYKFIVEKSESEYISNIEFLFEKYVEEMHFDNINNNQFVKKEDNITENKFIRDLYNLFNSNLYILDNNQIIKNSLFTHLISILYDKHMDEKQISNVLKNSKISTAFSEFKCSFFIDDIDNRIHVKIEKISL